MSDYVEMHVEIPLDDEGMLGRECCDCERYFKIKPGTGLETTECHCPYCDYYGESNTFWTKAQIEYIKSIAMPKIMNEVVKPSLREMFKSLERKNRNSMIKFSISDNNSADEFPINYYTEEELETKIECDNCGLIFAVYGFFANCPDCNQLNAFIIYRESLIATEHKLKIFMKPEIPQNIRNDSLKHILTDCVSSFDALGKELVKKKPHIFKTKTKNLFQKIGLLDEVMNMEISNSVCDYQFLREMFQVRHIFEHNMGVIDSDFTNVISGYNEDIGKKYNLNVDQLLKLINEMSQLGDIVKTYFESN